MINDCHQTAQEQQLAADFHPKEAIKRGSGAPQEKWYGAGGPPQVSIAATGHRRKQTAHEQLAAMDGCFQASSLLRVRFVERWLPNRVDR